MEPFKSFRGLVATLDRANIDTDQIIPKQFLKSIQRTGFGENLFYDWRYLADGKLNPEFLLNQPQFKNASILVVRNNFGCGSSREHAVWAIQQYGFKAVVAPWIKRENARVPGFADIFKNNCSKNSLLTIELSEGEVEEIFQTAARFPGLEATVNLDKQQIAFHTTKETSFHFDIDAAMKQRLIHGLDDIGITLQYEDAIRKFEAHHPQRFSAKSTYAGRNTGR